MFDSLSNRKKEERFTLWPARLTPSVIRVGVAYLSPDTRTCGGSSEASVEDPHSAKTWLPPTQDQHWPLNPSHNAESNRAETLCPLPRLHPM